MATIHSLPPEMLVRALTFACDRICVRVVCMLTCRLWHSVMHTNAMRRVPLNADDGRPEQSTCIDRGLLNETACASAVRAGYMSLFRWLHAVGFPSTHVWYQAAASGNIATMRFVCGIMLPAIWPEYVCAAAAEHGHLSMLRWLRAEGAPWDVNTVNAAARHGHVRVLRYALKHGCPRGGDSMCAAAASGHMNAVRMLRFHGMPLTSDACETAARHGHLNVVRMIYRVLGSAGVDMHIMNLAALGGHVHVLEWLLANGFALHAWCARYAALGGHVHVLEWLRTKRAPFGDHVRKIATDRADVPMLSWLNEHGL